MKVHFMMLCLFLLDSFKWGDFIIQLMWMAIEFLAIGTTTSQGFLLHVYFKFWEIFNMGQLFLDDFRGGFKNGLWWTTFSMATPSQHGCWY
ncbi:hypothetical protein HanPI659440_Chr01g0002831 [Helianthus annuus]|nr:hypothetical protein HanPI659440_Chr01g0002831 [Helianthus annuus]